MRRMTRRDVLTNPTVWLGLALAITLNVVAYIRLWMSAGGP